MSVRLEAIKFNHDTSRFTADALNIRKQSSGIVRAPEWVRDGTNAPLDSLAAYAINETQGETITIQARFRRTNPALQTVLVHAVDLDPNSPTVLGEASLANPITFPNGDLTGFLTLNLDNPRIEEAGVGAHTVEWQWEFRIPPDEEWTPFHVSRHRIYTVLSRPNYPWAQFPFTDNNLGLPWAEVLEHACEWARGARTAASAATRVTRRVNTLGPSLVEYPCDGGASYYTCERSFNCGGFLDLLNGGDGNGFFLNCSDCASIVSSFSNILGCDIHPAEMGYNFSLNPILLIGFVDDWSPACVQMGFGFHEAAWTGQCREDDRVFDACLKIDGDEDPTDEPRTPLLPANIRFGRQGEGQYSDRLAAPHAQGRPRCNPRGERIRRAISPISLCGDTFMLADRFEDLKHTFGFAAWRDDLPLHTNLFIWNYSLRGDELDGWKGQRVEKVTTSSLTSATQSFWRLAEGGQDARLSMETYERESRAAAREFLLALIARLQVPKMLTNFRRGEIGDVAFSTPRDTLILFCRGNLVVSLKNAGREQVSLADVAAALDNQLVSQPAVEASNPLAAAAEVRLVKLPEYAVKAGGQVPLGLIAAENSPVWYKFFSARGEILSVNGRLYYLPERAAPREQDIKVYTYAPDNNLVAQSLTLIVE